MPLPNFVILGAAKAGTTALYYYLMQHPEIHVTPLKETNFFALEGETLRFAGPGDDAYVNRLSVTSWEDYLRQYQGAETKKARGEASPLYLYHPRTAENIKDRAPDVKLIVIVRNPVDRAFSAFLHLVRDGREPLSDFRAGLKAEEARIAANWEHIWHYKRMGLYHSQLARYFALFPPEQIKVFLYKDLRTEPVRMVQDIFRFLDVDTGFVPDMSQRHNVTKDLPPERKPALLPDVRRELRDYFGEDALRLQSLIGRDLSHWLQDDRAAQEAEAEPAAK